MGMMAGLNDVGWMGTGARAQCGAGAVDSWTAATGSVSRKGKVGDEVRSEYLSGHGGQRQCIGLVKDSLRNRSTLTSSLDIFFCSTTRGEWRVLGALIAWDDLLVVPFCIPITLQEGRSRQWCHRGVGLIRSLTVRVSADMPLVVDW
jgi:hypothetical protein